MKLEEKLPKQMVARTRKQNTELAYAIALTKLGDFLKAEVYAKRAVQTLERDLKINKSIPIEENICPSRDPKEIAKFRIKMQSLCLAYHHLASIEKSLGVNIKAVELFELSKDIGKKYVKDKKLLKIINDDAGKAKVKPSPIFSTKRKSLSNLGRITPKMNFPSEKQLLSEIFGKNQKPASKKPLMHTASLVSISKNFNDTFPSISLNIHEDLYGAKKRPSSSINSSLVVKPNTDESLNQSKARIVCDISNLRKLESSAAIKIQRFLRKIHEKSSYKHKLASFVVEHLIIPSLKPAEEQIEDSSRRVTIQSPGLSIIPSPVLPTFQDEPSAIEYQDKESDEQDLSDPDILVSVRVHPPDFTRKSRPSLFHYLDLSRPELYISHSVMNQIFSWKICIDHVKVKVPCIEMQFKILGHYENFTDCLYYSTVLSYDTSQKLDGRFMHPFEFQTIWPIVQTELAKNKREETDWGEDDMDDLAIEIIKDLAAYILTRTAIRNELTGTRLVFAMEKQTELAVACDFQASRHLYDRESVIRSAIIYGKHDEVTSVNMKQLTDAQEIGSIGCVLEKGIIFVSESYIMMSLEVTSSQDQDGTSFLTCLKLKLIALHSNWFDQLILTWEQANEIFEDFRYTLQPSYIFSTKRIPGRLREILYDRFSDYFLIENSKIVRRNTDDNGEFEVKELVVRGEALIEQCHEEWEAISEQYEEASHAEEIPNVCLGIVHSLNLRGEIDKIHLKLTGVQKNILIQAKMRLSDQILSLVVSDYAKVIRILTMFEMREVVKSMFENEFCIQKGLCGKILSNEVFRNKSSFSVVRVMDNIKYVVTIEIGRTVLISLYSLIASQSIITEFSKHDLAEYFPSIHAETYTAINHEIQFVTPLIQDFQLFRGILGRYAGWKLNIEENASLNSEHVISTFQFSNVKSIKPQNIISSRPLFEKKISALLCETSSYLMESVYQEHIITQKTRLVCGLYTLITVTKLILLEEWRIYIHIFQNSREFVCKLYDTDLFGLEDSAFLSLIDHSEDNSSPNTSIAKLWEIIILNGFFEHHTSLDFVFRFDKIVSPMRELLYSNHVKYSSHLYYEVYMKSSVTFNDRFTMINSMKEAEYIVLTFRSYSFARKLWVKTSLKLRDCVLILLNRGVLNEDILLNTAIKYSELKHFAGMLCRVVKMNTKENVVPVRLLPELEFSEEEEEDLFDDKGSEGHSVSDIFEQDLLLYQSACIVKPAVVIGVYFNRISDEFAAKVYKPHNGTVFRVPISKKKIFRVIPFSKTLLTNKAYLSLGEKILPYVRNKVLAMVP